MSDNLAATRAAEEAARRAAEQGRQAEEAQRAAQAQQAQAQTQALQPQRLTESIPGSTDPTSRASESATSSREAYLSRQGYDVEAHQRFAMDRSLAQRQAGENPAEPSELSALGTTFAKSATAEIYSTHLATRGLPDQHNQRLGDAASRGMERLNAGRVLSTRNDALDARADADAARQSANQAGNTHRNLIFDPQASEGEISRAGNDRLLRLEAADDANIRANQAELTANNTAHGAVNREMSVANEIGNLPRAALRGGVADAAVSTVFEAVEQRDALGSDDPARRNQALGDVAGEAVVGIGTAAAGAAAGALAGAATGAAIGSVVPGVGTAVGFAAGFALSYAADKMELGDKLGNFFGDAINGTGDLISDAKDIAVEGARDLNEGVDDAFGRPFRLV